MQHTVGMYCTGQGGASTTRHTTLRLSISLPAMATVHTGILDLWGSPTRTSVGVHGSTVHDPTLHPKHYPCNNQCLILRCLEQSIIPSVSMPLSLLQSLCAKPMESLITPWKLQLLCAPCAMLVECDP